MPQSGGPGPHIYILPQEQDGTVIQQCKIKFKPPNTKGILLNVQTVEDMDTPKIIVISTRDA
jgi:hypothetical protein